MHELERQRRLTANRRALLLGALGGLAVGVVPGMTALANMQAPPCDNNVESCARRMEVRKAAEEARRELNLGDAEAAADNLDKAREHWQKAIDMGLVNGAQAAVIAQKRLQMYTLTCSYNGKSLAALAANGNGKLVNLKVQQQALRALGYYQGALNGELTELTRSAIRKFQRDMAFDETDSLRPRQVVYLICNGAENARDNDTLTTLGLMYAAGVGVVQSNGFALALLRRASDRGHGPASFYLSLLHGVLHCTFVRNLDLADEYLKEACQQKHSLAMDLWKTVRVIPDQADRWARIGTDPRVVACLSIIPCAVTRASR